VHRYRLLDSARGLVGRVQMLRELNDWTGSAIAPSLLICYAIGGTGKSAIAWTWFNELFSQSKGLAKNRIKIEGGLWYCFSKPGDSFSDFLRKLYEYVMGSSEVRVSEQRLGEQSFEGLFARLRNNTYVIVLDAFESVLRAFGKDKLSGGESADQAVASELTIERPLELCLGLDENVNRFIESLGQALSSRVLITTRLVPAAALNAAGDPRPSTKILRLSDLDDEEVIDLLAAYGVSGSHSQITSLTHKVGNHALLVKLIAGMVARDRAHPRQFDAWLNARPEFSPNHRTVAENITQVFAYALRQLRPFQMKVLLHVTVLSGAVSYDELCDLLASENEGAPQLADIDEALATLDQLNLVEWNQKDNTYAAHPLVRTTVWQQTPIDSRAELDEGLIRVFASEFLVAKRDRERDLYFAYIRRRRFERAWSVYRSIRSQAGDGMGLAQSEVIDMFTALLSASTHPWPQLADRGDRANFTVELAFAYEMLGDLEQAVKWYRDHRPICENVQCPAHEAQVLASMGRVIDAENINRHVISELRAHNVEGEIPVLRNWFNDAGSIRGAIKTVIRREAALLRKRFRFVRRKDLSSLWSIRCKAAREAADRGVLNAVKKWRAIANREYLRAEAAGNSLRAIQIFTELAIIARREGRLDECFGMLHNAEERARKLGVDQGFWRVRLELVSTAIEKELFTQAE